MKGKIKETIREWLLITLGTVLIGVGVYFFKFPNHFSTGGVTGLAVVLDHFIPSFTPGDLVLLVNGLLLILGFAVFGRNFGLKTVYASVVQSMTIWILERLVPLTAPLTGQPFLELIFAVTLPAIGAAILFNLNASGGGTDIIAMVMRKYTALNIGNALFISDSLITLGAFAFGVETGLFSVLGLAIKSVMIDLVLEHIHSNKCFHIITGYPEPILSFVVNTLQRGATVLQGEGAFTHQGQKIILTVVNRHQAVLLRRFVKSTDQKAFILITDTGEIIGKGFRGLN